jgi:arginyl-tRNA synthetase
MNIFENFLQTIEIIIIKNEKLLGLKNNNDFKGVTVESPPSNFNFDLSTNVGLILAKINNLNPINVSEQIRDILIKDIKDIKDIEVVKPGFININFTNEFIQKFINEINKNKNTYGSAKKNKKYNIEFVSANPTGPMHVGHCRGAIYGDVLANLLKFNGNDVIKEYYVNDYGNQIKNFTKSVFLRIREIKYKEKFIDEKDLYPGEYIIDIAKKIIKNNNKLTFDKYQNVEEKLVKESLEHSMDLIKSDLKSLGITHDNFFSETEIVNNNLVVEAIEKLKKRKYVVEGYLNPPKGEEVKNWKKIKRLIFKSTLFGDDSDRALQKNDGTWTYFANDVAYHMSKVSRKYSNLINVLGADHTGYVKRITAAVKALSEDQVKLNCKICQLVKLYKNGKPFKMSKRAGDFISANDLLKEVNKDSIRFMMLNRSNDVELDFDFDKVLEKSKDNPVFYVQYCYARINSLFKLINLDLNNNILLDQKKFDLNIYERNILRKIFEWPKIIDASSKKYEPHRICFYLYDLATLFHSYWSKGNENDDYKFIKDNKVRNINTIAIIQLITIVVKNGMNILGVSLPNKM